MSSGDSDSESVVSSEVSSGGDLEAMMVLVTASGCLFHFHVGPREVKKLLWSAVKNKSVHWSVLFYPTPWPACWSATTLNRIIRNVKGLAHSSLSAVSLMSASLLAVRGNLLNQLAGQMMGS